MLRHAVLCAICAALALILGGCANVLSRAALEQVDPGVDYAQVKLDPDAHRGQTLVLGGQIVANRGDREGTTLELIHYFVDHWGRPTGPDENGGRFLVQSQRFLDPELYRRGRLVTLTGTVIGGKTKTLNGRDYRYPVFKLGEIHLFTPPETWYDRPGGRYYNPYAPWPYGYGNDPGWIYPYWYGPGWDYPYGYGYGDFWFGSDDD